MIDLWTRGSLVRRYFAVELSCLFRCFYIAEHVGDARDTCTQKEFQGFSLKLCKNFPRNYLSSFKLQKLFFIPKNSFIRKKKDSTRKPPLSIKRILTCGKRREKKICYFLLPCFETCFKL